MFNAEDEIMKGNHVEFSVSRSTRRTTRSIIKSSNGRGATNDITQEEYGSNIGYVKASSNKRNLESSKKSFHTSDYSSEEGENEIVSSTQMISEVEKNRILEDARKAANTSEGITPLGLYLKAKRYWDKYPKTDWTYSPFSKDRVEIAPGQVAMPNMSRRHISSYDKYTNTENFPARRALFDGQQQTTVGKTNVAFTAKRVLMVVFTVILALIRLPLDFLSYSISTVHFVSMRLAKVVHRLSSRVMLLDTWLLRRRRIANRKSMSLMALCLVPLLFFGGWWCVNVTSESIYQRFFNDSSSSYPPLESVSDPVDISKIENIEITTRSTLNDAELESIANRIRSNLNIDFRQFGNTNLELERKIEHQQSLIDTLTEEVARLKIKEDDHEKSITAVHNKLNVAFSNLTKVFNMKFDNFLKLNSQIINEKIIEHLKEVKFNGRLEGGFFDDAVRKIVKDVLTIYDADKTGLVDYALEPMGGQIITTRCTETYFGSGVYSVLGLPVWYISTSPRTVIEPGINPGKCWAFQNFPGLLVIKLMAPVKIESFSMEHVSRLLVPDGKMDSAPKDFEVYGLSGEEDTNGIKIGEYKYNKDGEPVQFFEAPSDSTFEYVELRITSNHGNPNYTCLYRFRVHGQIFSK